MKLTAEQIRNSKVGKLNAHLVETYGDAYAKTFAPKPAPVEREPITGTPEASERDLHDKIEAHCRNMGWCYSHSRMDQPTTTNLGVADFIIFWRAFSKVSPQGLGKVLLIECKMPGRKQSAAQLHWAEKAQDNGQKVHIVHTFEEFERLLGG